jgi:hypothetical protein
MGIVYDTREDVVREDVAWAEIAVAWGVHIQVTPDWHTSDGRLLTARGGRLLAVGEVKGRNYPDDQYPRYMLRARKWDNNISESRARGVPAVIFDRGPDGVTQWLEPAACPVARRDEGGRRDRHDPNDRAEHVWIDWRLFRPLTVRPPWCGP